MGDDRCPAADVRQPAEHAARRVYDIEVAVEFGRQVIEVCPDEPRVLEPELGRERSRQLDRGR